LKYAGKGSAAKFLLSDSTTFNGLEENEKTKSWSNFFPHFESEKEAKTHWKDDNSNTMKNSTISLNIAAYENSTVAAASEIFNGKNNHKLKKEESKFKIFTAASTCIVQNPFEFPRQQSDKMHEPEASKYKASQRLLNPNEASNNGRQGKMVRSPVSDRRRERSDDRGRRHYDDDREKVKKSRRRSRSRSKERERDRYSSDRRRDDKSRDRERHRERDDRRSRHNDYDRKSSPPVKPKRFEETHLKEEPIPWNEFPPPKPQNVNEGMVVEEEPVEKEKPSLKPSGKLLEDTNMVNGVVVKYVEPPEAKVPKVMWQLHPFRNQEGKDPEPLPVMHIHRRSCYLIGRDRKVVQFPMDHPSCSKQHAALQFRSLPYTKPSGERSRRTKPYIIDLESANGTFLNDDKLESTRYYELKHGDEIRFGFSSRSFVILNATAALNQMDDSSNVKKEDESDDDEEEQSSKNVATKEDKFE
jgi:smad nuclear-interacting protein 1